MPPEATLAAYVVGAAAYSLSAHLLRRKASKNRTFRPRRLLRAIIVGLVVGAFAYQTGAEVTPTNFEHLATASGAVAIADQAVAYIYRFAASVRGSVEESDGE